jgi:hypothetical protein
MAGLHKDTVPGSKRSRTKITNTNLTLRLLSQGNMRTQDQEVIGKVNG